MTRSEVKRNVGFVLVGVAAMLLKARYSAQLPEPIRNGGGNAAGSFAVYFMIGSSALGRRFGRLGTVFLALLAVQSFEATDGFGVMTNTYDPMDYMANVVGIGIAVAVDLATAVGWRKTPPPPVPPRA